MGLAPFLGILSLDTAFERIVGDVGNPASYPFAARVLVVAGADSPLIVQDRPLEAALTQRFIAAAQELEAEGAVAIISTCGFLVSIQDQVAASVSVPVLLSALSLYLVVARIHRGKIGILTASEPALGARALAAAGVAPERVVIAGMQDCTAFTEAFLPSRDLQTHQLNRFEIEVAVVQKAQDLQSKNPTLSALILECGNLPPYGTQIKEATGLPVYNLRDAAHLLWAASTGGVVTQ